MVDCRLWINVMASESRDTVVSSGLAAVIPGLLSALPKTGAVCFVINEGATVPTQHTKKVQLLSFKILRRSSMVNEKFFPVFLVHLLSLRVKFYTLFEKIQWVLLM